jgi:predicted MFS family arabinose efflux permease
MHRAELASKASQSLWMLSWPLFISFGISQLGNWMFRAGAVYEIFDKQGGEGALLGWTILCVYVPILAGGKWLSPLADKFNSVTILVMLDILRSLLLVPIIIWSDMSKGSNVALVFVVIICLSLSTPLFSSAQSSYIRKTFHSDQVASAISIISNIGWATNILGTMFGALLLFAFSFRSIIIIDIFTFLGSLVIMIIYIQKTLQSKHFNNSTTATEDQPSSGKTAWLLLISIFFLNLGAGVINLYPNVLAREVYHIDQFGLGYFYLGNGIGGFIGAFVVPKLRKRIIADIPVMVFSALLIAIFLFGMSLFYNTTLSVFTSSLMLLFGQIFGVVAHSYLLTTHPVQKAGKTSGLFMFSTFLGVAVNAVLFSVFFSKVTLANFSLFLKFCSAAGFISFLLLAIYEINKRKKKLL